MERKRLKILLVDDDEHEIALIRRALDKAGQRQPAHVVHQVPSAPPGSAAQI